MAPPTNSGAASIDGLPVEPRHDRGLPWRHQLTLAGSNLSFPDRQEVKVQSATPAAVDFNLQLTDQARPNAAAVLKDPFAACAAITGLGATQCPQGIIDVAVGPVSWSLIGDQLADVSYPVAADGAVSGQGRFQMAATHLSQTLGSQHCAVGGAYQAHLSWSGDKFTVTTIDFRQGRARRPPTRR